MLLELIACVPVLLVVKFLFTREPDFQCGVYAVPGKWYYLKKWMFWVLYKLRQRKKLKEAQEGGVGYGVRSHTSEKDMEMPQKLDDDPNSLDAVYIEGGDTSGTFFVLRIGRRHDRKAELWLSVNIPGQGFFQHPIHPDTLACNTDGETFSAGGLRMECLEPMIRWKVNFNGLLRKGLHNEWTEDKGELVHVTFSFIWEATSDMFNFDTDMDPSLIADAIAREKWTKTFWTNLKSKHQTHYEQAGGMRGVWKVEGQEELKLHLRGFRDHSYGCRDWKSFHRYVVHFCYLENGSLFHCSRISLPETTSNLQAGYYAWPNGEMEPIEWTTLELPMLGENINPPDKYSFTFTSGGKTRKVSVETKLEAKYHHGDDWSNVIFEKMCTFDVDGVKGYGITEFCYRDVNGKTPVPKQESVLLLKEPSSIPAADQTSLALPFAKHACCLSRLVGGKGCQLAMLTQLNSKDFEVPPGFCLTISAFHLHLDKNPHLTDHVSKLQDICSTKVSGDIKEACEATVEAFLSTPVSGEIQKVIAAQLIQLCSNPSEQKFAVRSSAAGEDSAELSAAGQMETILGVKGFEQIFAAVAKCWASHFGLIAVEYRRQHGQPIRSSTGVVIQQMVRAEEAGVLFTREPITGSPAKMVLSANYGLGESVVSGVSDPDNIVVSRSYNDDVTILEEDIGKKKIQIIMKDDGGTEEVEVDTSQGSRCCVSDDMVLRLAKIGIKLEKHFANARDIEWAISGDTIYLLQARPITTLDKMTEWELLHEFDTPLSSDTEIMTTANIGEMMPGAMTPLTLSVFFRSIDRALVDSYQHQGLLKKAHKWLKFLCLSTNHGFINVSFMNLPNKNNTILGDPQVAQLSVLGEVLDEITDEYLLKYHGSKPWYKKVINGLTFMKVMNGAHAKTVKWENYLKTYNVGDRCKTAEELWNTIDKEMPKYYACCLVTIFLSYSCGSWNMIVMSVLSQGNPQWTSQMYSDVAMLLSKCDDVYSADVPAAMQNLATTIANSGKSEEFSQLETGAAVEWLKTNENIAIRNQFIEFMSRHGHRCVREAEFREKSWNSEPEKLVKVLQNLSQVVQNSPEKAQKKVEDINEAVASVKSHTTTFGRFVLRRLLGRARKAVGAREWGKSLAILMCEKFKLAYWKLAKLMVEEGRLPDEDLLFFLTHHEIGHLLKTRSGALVSKALRRQRLLPKQMELTYQRLNFGYPKLLEDDNGTECDYVITSLKLKGLPVSQGVVRSTARVVTSLAEASAIQPGDILIVPFTDVGWTPYFPLISGLVTEIGGLVSHGAVVAREYGIPCVCNIFKATSMFKSGDEVILNGTEGTVEKVEE